MTCNPFTSAAAKFSQDTLRPDNITIKAFDEVLDFNSNPANRFDSQILKRVVKNFNGIIQTTDLRDFSTLKERKKQSQITTTEFAEFLENQSISLERVESILENRRIGPTIEEGLIDTVSVISYPQNPPGVFQKLKASGGSGTDASFDVIVNTGGNSLVIPSNLGQDYTAGDRLLIDDLGIEIEVQSVSSITSLEVERDITNGTDFINLLSDFDFFLDDSFGSSITSGQCGSINLGILGALFGLIGSLRDFKNIIPNLIEDIWNGAKEFVTSLPSILEALKESFMKIIDTIVDKAKRAVEGFKQSIANVGTALQTIAKEFGNLENFFSDDNVQKVKNVVSSIIQKMVDQFENPSMDIIEWILTRMCQVSDFISQFMNNPINEFASLLGNVTNTKNILGNESNLNTRRASIFGAVRFDQKSLRQQARAAADRSGRATAAGGGRAATDGSVPARAATGGGSERPAIYAPSFSLITDEELAQVMQNVTRDGWPGYFTFAPSVLNNNYGPREGERIEDAGWKIIRDHVPMTFYRLKQVIDEVGGGPYVINSAYRSLEYNSTQVRFYRNNPNNPGRWRSRHIIGTAVDVMGAQARRGFRETASAYGFTEILSYNSFMHIALPRHFGLGSSPRTPDQQAIDAAAEPQPQNIDIGSNPIAF